MPPKLVCVPFLAGVKLPGLKEILVVVLLVSCILLPGLSDENFYLIVFFNILEIYELSLLFLEFPGTLDISTSGIFKISGASSDGFFAKIY